MPCYQGLAIISVTLLNATRCKKMLQIGACWALLEGHIGLFGANKIRRSVCTRIRE